MTVSEVPSITLRCPHCEGGWIKVPRLQAPEGYAFDSTLVLVRCMDCGRRPTLSDCTVVEES